MPRRFGATDGYERYRTRITGRDPPQRVAEAVLVFVLSHLAPTELPDQFDASLIRRRFPDADAEIPRLIER